MAGRHTSLRVTAMNEHVSSSETPSNPAIASLSRVRHQWCAEAGHPRSPGACCPVRSRSGFGHPYSVVKPSGRRSEAAARKSVDPDRLLPGEPMDSDDAKVAERWTAVYKDLRDTKRVMIKSAEGRIADARPEAQREFQATDATTLAAERRRIERRLGFWRTRLRTLKAKLP